MKDIEVYTKLRNMGMTCFVKYYHDFANVSLSRHDLTQILIRSEGYTLEACATQNSNARTIIGAGAAKVILELIIHSDKVPKHIRGKAKKMCCNLP